MAQVELQDRNLNNLYRQISYLLDVQKEHYPEDSEDAVMLSNTIKLLSEIEKQVHQKNH